MKALLPVFCRPLGYVILVLSVFAPFLMWSKFTGHNFLLYKECFKLLMMVGCLFILFALSKSESAATERIRNVAVRNAIFITFFLVFANMLWRVARGDIANVSTSMFLVFLLVNVICLEFGMQKARVDKLFKR
ncbi:MAG: hypothetical protein LBN29_02985 [Mediterranea sp.]|jgi:hypothetical protein|nr:hypothetical protein [Mediterranea sp.]